MNRMDKKQLIQSFGRRRSRGLSKSQKDSLANLHVKFGININIAHSDLVDPHKFFDQKFDDIIVEIGFGMGEHLIENAKQNPNSGMIGCEPFENGVANVFRTLDEKNIKNVRVYKNDARILLASFEASSVSRFYVLFPDPWNKKRHSKRRLLSVDFMNLMVKKLKIGGEVIVATDCEKYMREILENVSKLNGVKAADSNVERASTLERPAWFISTKYEQKAIKNGKQPYYTKFDKIAEVC